MRAAPFEYFRVADIDGAYPMLAADDSARVNAGWQTLVPMMTMRLARPTRLIDTNRIAALSYIREDGDGIVISATTGQCVIERGPLIGARHPLLARAIPFIGFHNLCMCELFIGPMVTMLPAGACLSAAHLPVWTEAKIGVGFHEVDVRRRDFAFVSAAAQVELSDDGKCKCIVIGTTALPFVSGRLKRNAQITLAIGDPVEGLAHI